MIRNIRLVLATLVLFLAVLVKFICVAIAPADCKQDYKDNI